MFTCCFLDYKKRLGYLLHESLKSDDLYPVFNLSIWRYYEYDEEGNRAETKTVHTSVDDFFMGMDEKVTRFLDHVENCKEKFGEEFVLLEE